MSNMKQVFDKSVEKFEEKFVPMLRAFVRQPVETATEKEIKSFLKHHTLALIDAEIERKKGEIDESIKEDGDEGWSNYVGIWEDFLEEVGRQKQIRNDLTYLKEQRELIDNS